VRGSLRLLLAAAVLSIVPQTAHATKYAGEFLKLQLGARAIGMGAAFVGVADDATAPYWNPAGMVYLPYREVQAMHSERFGELLNHDFIGAVVPIGSKKDGGGGQAVGLSLIRLGVDDIPVTPRPGSLRPGQDFIDGGADGDISTNDPGNLDGIWQPGERLLSLDLYRASSSDLAMLLSYARQKGPHWAFGGNMKFIRQSVPDTIPGESVTSFGASLDIGMLYMPMDAATIGVVVHDLTTGYLSWSNGTRESINPTIDTGVSFNFYPAERMSLTWALDLGWSFDDRQLDTEVSMGSVGFDVRTGLEYWYRNTVALRSGVNGKDLAFGAGLRYKHFGVDYAASLHRFFASDAQDFPDDQNLDTTHLVSGSYSW
jgi:hypothetical protein